MMMKMAATTTTRGSRGRLAVVLWALLALSGAAAVAVVSSAASALSVDFHAATCPGLDGMVRSAVQTARGQDAGVTAGLLRIFFHDCFPEGQGCDASILLDGGPGIKSEKDMGPNVGLNRRALDLIEEIRSTVHSRCGTTVSCADIIALATAHAVNLAQGPLIPMPLGRNDSLVPAPEAAVNNLPRPDSGVATLLGKFRARGLSTSNAMDLVALSGGHTVGTARCSSFDDRTRSRNPNDKFAADLARFCSGNPGRRQNLDVDTPNTFDNAYFKDLKKGQAVLTSDKVLADDPSTGWIVDAFAGDQERFFHEFAKSMIKLSQLKGPRPGPVRTRCSRPAASTTTTTTSSLLDNNNDNLELLETTADAAVDETILLAATA